MKRIMVRYVVKPEHAEENRQYIEKVFAELRRNSPPGLRYASFQQPDGVSFMHLVSVETANGDNPLSQSPAFKDFQAGIHDRCQEQPVVTEIDEVGSYQFFGG